MIVPGHSVTVTGPREEDSSNNEECPDQVGSVGHWNGQKCQRVQEVVLVGCFEDRPLIVWDIL